MTNKIFNLTSTFKSLGEEDDGSIKIRGMASTTAVDRAGDVVASEAWTKGGLENFLSNPIILFNHNYDRPIGKATKLSVTDNGLEMEAKISKSAPEGVAELIKEGILGAFSVGFRVKDADYVEETDGLRIKDAELFEVSVVSVPCNQSATFSLAKSFDSIEEYNEFKKTFTNRVDLAGQSLAAEEANASSVASETPDGANSAQQEIKMSDENQSGIDLEAFAKKVAEDTAARIAMKQAEEKAAEKAAEKEAAEKAAQEAEAKAAQEAEVQATIKMGVESGAERLVKDFEAKLAEKDAKIDEVLKEFKTQLEEKNDELTKIRESKRVFADRDAPDAKQYIKSNAEQFMHAHLLGVVTGKGIQGTDMGRELLEKGGLDYTTSAGDIAQEVSTQIEKEVMLELRAANLFREMQVNSQTTVLPLQTDATGVAWGSNQPAPAGNLQNLPQDQANVYEAKQKILTAYRLVSTTEMEDIIDEQVLPNLMPMLTDSIARAHARAVDEMIIQGATSGSSGFVTATPGGAAGFAASATGTLSIGGADKLTAAALLATRKQMGKYGVNPSDVAYIVSQDRYFELIEDPAFADITDVGSNVATKITGSIGSVYGSPVIISDNFAAEASGQSVAVAVHARNYIMPRLRGIAVETDREVREQKRVIVATQSLGFDELFAGDVTRGLPSIKIDLAV